MTLIVDLLRQSCLKFGDKPAFRVKTAGQWNDYSYRQLWTDSDHIATALSEWGFQNGERAAILAPASPVWVSAYFGIMKANGIIVPIDKELKRGEVRHVLEDCGARLIFTTEDHLDTVRELLGTLPALEKVVLLTPPLAARVRMTSQAEGALAELVNEWRRLAADYHIRKEDIRRLETSATTLQNLLTPGAAWSETGGRVPPGILKMERRRHGDHSIETIDTFKKDGKPPALIRQADDVAVILYTSGTTGRSKGAMLSHANIVSNIRTATAVFDLDENIRMLSFLPINHVFEQVAGMLLPLSLGGTVSFVESLKKLGDNLVEVKPNFLLGVPAVFRLLLDRLQRNIEGRFLSRTLFAFALTRPLIVRKVRETLGGMPIFVSGGAALDPEVARGLMDLGIMVYQGYGITETSPVIAVESPRARKLGTVGLPFPGVDVRINQPNDEGVGEIWVKGPNVMRGYYNNPQATAEVLTDGWYHTGDLGRLDSDGMLSICGRLKNVIVTANGKNVYPEEVENELLHSPFIAEVMVYGHKVSRTAEEVYALIYPDQEALDRYAREHGLAPMTEARVEGLIRDEVLRLGKNLADYKRIRKFNLREDEFPKTTTRKIKRFIVEAGIDAVDAPDETSP
ncbi:MAG: long-chain fatty acid--CoA ligase [Deltaproteobacteria bacterium]|nr:MAG: long-chain fatty acid--CoA ligase [Deltaproteobacteria bacterium]